MGEDEGVQRFGALMERAGQKQSRGNRMAQVGMGEGDVRLCQTIRENIEDIPRGEM